MSEKKRRPGRYPDEVRERAVRMVFDHQAEYPSQWKAIESISKKLSITHETLRQWVRRAETDTGQRPGLTTDERAKMARQWHDSSCSGGRQSSISPGR
jgi:transposase